MKASGNKPMNRATQPSKLKPVILLAALLVGAIVGCEACSDRYENNGAVIQVCFSPEGHCTQLVEAAIAKAQKTILVQADYFTSLPIADALIAAHQRGVTVKLLVDRSQLTGKYAQVRHVMKQGIAVAVDKVPGIAHNKVMIIDDQYVLTGSFNWTEAAETRNAENLLLIKDSKTNSLYKAAWHRRAEQAQAPQFGK